MTESAATLIPSLTPLIYRGEGWSLRSISAGDKPAFQTLLAEVPFGGALNLREDRRGDPTRLRTFEAQGTQFKPTGYLIEDDTGAPIGCLSMVVRPGRFGTDTINICHLSDLRIIEQHRGAKVLPAALQAACEDIRAQHGVEVFFTGVFDQDERALGALTHRDDRRYQQPMAQIMHQLNLGLVPLRSRTVAAPTRRIERCSSATLDEVGDLLARSHAMSTLGRAESAAGFASRLHQATGGELERVIMVRESRGGALACCGLVLPTGDMRRLVLNPMKGEAASMLRRFNLKRWIGAYPRLPVGEDPIPLLQLCFVAQRDEEPGPLRDLFLAVLSETWEDDARWLSLSAPRHGPAARVLDQLPVFKVPLSLLAVTPAGTRWNNVDFRTQRCGIDPLFL